MPGKKAKVAIFTDAQLLRMSEMEELEKDFRAYYGLPDPCEDCYWYDGYEDELMELRRRWIRLHPKDDDGAFGVDPNDLKFWSMLKHVIDVAREGASTCKANSKEYWKFCTIIGELLTLIGDERYERLKKKH